MRIAHLSDIHFGGENAEAVAAATQCLAADHLDLVVVSGDLTRFGEKGEFASAAAWLKQLPEPRLVTPGNHDAPYLAWHDRLFTLSPAMSGPSAAPASRRTSRPVWRSMASTPRAACSPGQLVQGPDLRASGGGGPGLVRRGAGRGPEDRGLPPPAHRDAGRPHDRQGLAREAAAKAFAEAGVDLVLTGHIHAPFTWPYGYGDGKTYAAGAGTLSIRERGVPPGFNIIETDAAEMRVTALAWTGSKFESERVWSLSRR
uniref:Metallophosphoesterase n=1 Tax=Phenylobacterium glaciei TaxID=2803784 RepID=A0A974P3T4_9CAUL|nr:metallophosphoesterase [Phenylobacterium glaciei]